MNKYTFIDWKYYKQTLIEIDSKDILSALEFMGIPSKRLELQLEDSNLWKPTCEQIKINPKEASETIPQAWKNNWNWYYNFDWALLEAKTLWKKIPTKEDWEEIIENNNKEVLKLPKLGFRNDSNAYYYYQGTDGYYWSSSPNGIYGYYVSINSTQVYPLYNGNRAYGFTVRCLKN